MKKLTAILLALALVLGMSSALAETPAPNGQTGDTGVNNLCTITIYVPDQRTVEDEMVEWSYPESIVADFDPGDEEVYPTLVARDNPKVEVTNYMILPTSKIKIGIARLASQAEYMAASADFNFKPKGDDGDSTYFFAFTISMGSMIEIDKDTVDNEANLTRTFSFSGIQNAFYDKLPKKGTGHIIGEGPQLEGNAETTFYFFCVIEHPEAE